MVLTRHDKLPMQTPPFLIRPQVERYNYFFTALAQKGISTFAFDQRGWGRTAQKTNTQGITDLRRQLQDLEYFTSRELARCQPMKLFLFGHSMVSRRPTTLVNGVSHAEILSNPQHQGGGIVLQYACTPSPSRPSLSRLAGVVVSSPITVQPPESRVSRMTLHAGALIGRILPSLQMKIEIKGTVSLCLFCILSFTGADVINRIYLMMKKSYNSI